MPHADRLLLAFISLSITSGMAAGILQLLLPLYAISLSVSAAGVGTIRGLAQFGGLVTSLPGGFIIDHFGARKVYIVSCLLDGFLISLIPFVTTPFFLTCFLFLEAAIGTLRWTTVNSAFFTHLESFGHSRAGWTRASLAVGANFIGPLIGGILTQLFSFKWSYALVGGVVAAPALFLPLYQPPRSRRETHAALPGESLLEQLRQLMENRLLWRVALLQGAGISSNSAFIVFIILFVVGTLGGPPRLASMLIAVQGVSFVASMFWGGRLLEKYRLKELYSASYLTQAVGLITVGSLSNLWFLGAGSIIFGLGSGMLTTISFSRLASMSGQKGKLTGLFFLITGTGVALGPLWGGLLVHFFGIRGAFLGFLPILMAPLLFVCLTSDEDVTLPSIAPSNELA